MAAVEQLDELHYSCGSEERLEIWSSQRKNKWVAREVVRVDETGYSPETAEVQNGMRLFITASASLQGACLGSRAIFYRTDDVIVKE